MVWEFHTKWYLNFLILKSFKFPKQNSLKFKDVKLSKIAFSYVGFEKNLFDTEHMQGLLDKKWYKVDSDINDVNVVVVNICNFIEINREESIWKILNTNQVKEAINSGCMAQHFKDELLKEITEIKLWLEQEIIKR